MVKKILIGAVGLLSAVAGLLAGSAGGLPVATVQPARAAGCGSVPAFATAKPAAVAAGRGLFVVAGGRLVSAELQRSLGAPGAGPDEAIRHVAAEPGLGTAYVVDRAGGDEILALTPDGQLRVPQRSEISHPAWSPAGDLAWSTGSAIAVRHRASGRIERLRTPIDGGTMFSPVFLRGGLIASVVAAPPSARTPEGGRLDNVWVTRRGDRAGWRRVTSFRSSGDRWVMVRTPLEHRGSLHFVRVDGRASATGVPSFELWRLDGERAIRVSRLPEERYLAGSDGARLVWNVPDPSNARTLLVVDGPDGQRTIGCGAVMVDPLDAVDPDRRARRGARVPPRGDWPELETPSHDHAEQIAVIVGDFPTATEAQAAVATIIGAYPGSQVDVADSSTSPLAIRPGVFGAMLHLPLNADATAALAEFRERLPGFAANSWIVTP